MTAKCTMRWIVSALLTAAVLASPKPSGAADREDVLAFGSAAFHGSTGRIQLAHPLIAIGRTHTGGGYWTVAADGGVFAFGDARFHGSTGAMRLNKPIVGMATHPHTSGYWFVATDGGVFSFNVPFHGSTGAMALNQPVVGMAATRSGDGYWLVASDGGIFSFGDAGFAGSTGAIRLNQPIVGMAADPDGTGYWLVAADGGMFSFDARFHGSAAGLLAPGDQVVAMAAAPDGNGYWVLAHSGAVFGFGDVSVPGSGAGDGRAFVGIAAAREGDGYWLAASSAPAGLALTADTPIGMRGVGPVLAGMTVRDAQAAAGRPFTIEEFDTFDGFCFYATPHGMDEDLFFLVESPGETPVADPLDGVITRVSAYSQMASPAAADSGIRMGSTEADVFAAYPGQVESEQHVYDPSGKYLTVLGTGPTDGYGIRFETSEGRVDVIHGGFAHALHYIEGCA